MQVEELLHRYLNSLERENKLLLLENQKLRSECKDLDALKEEYESALEDIDKRDTLLWKLGLSAASDEQEKKAIVLALGETVSKMQQSSPITDVDAVVEKLYSDFC